MFMTRDRLTVTAALALASAFSGCAVAASKGAAIEPSLQTQVQAALLDAAAFSQLPLARLRVVDAEFVTWANGAAGCPQPGMLYTDALVPGVRVRIQAGKAVLHYHGGRRGALQRCPAERVEPAAPDGALR